MSTSGYYAVAVGRATGIFRTWDECNQQVERFRGCKYKKFKTQSAAQAYLDAFTRPQRESDTKRPRSASAEVEDNGTLSPALKRVKIKNLVPIDMATQSWYGVARGRKTGVYQTWNEAKQQIDNFQNAKFKKFKTKNEAEEFVAKHGATTRRQEKDPDPQDPTTLVAFCDGSALGNGRRGCRAGYACIFPHCEAWNVAKKLVEKGVTNNRAEYMGALEALKRANLEDPEQSQVLYIFTDSMLLIRSMTEFLSAWIKNNWLKSNGSPVLNRDLLELLTAERGNRSIRWIHVKAHTHQEDWQSLWNDVADHAARSAASSVRSD